MKVLGGSRWEIVQSNKKNEGENQEETCHGRTMMHSESDESFKMNSHRTHIMCRLVRVLRK